MYTCEYKSQWSVIKHRVSKAYRHPTLDERLTRERQQGEARTLTRARKLGIPVPTLYLSDPPTGCLIMECVPGPTVKAWLQGQVGPLARGQQIVVTTADGRILGAISPYGVPSGAAAGTYTLPLPPDALQGDRIAVRLSLSQFGGPARSPTAQEVPRLTIRVDPPGR